MSLRHDTALTVAISIAIIVAGVLTWAACHWWYGRKLQAAAERLRKSEKERAFARDQILQARRQVDKLKAELATTQRSVSESQTAAQQRAVRLEEERQAAERAQHDPSFMPIVAALGFADTQILP